MLLSFRGRQNGASGSGSRFSPYQGTGTGNHPILDPELTLGAGSVSSGNSVGLKLPILIRHHSHCEWHRDCSTNLQMALSGRISNCRS